MKRLLKKILPPIFEDIRKAFKPVHFLGPYGTLEEAKSQVRTKAFESKAWIQNTLDKFDRVPGLKDGFFPQHQFLLSTLNPGTRSNLSSVFCIHALLSNAFVQTWDFA